MQGLNTIKATPVQCDELNTVLVQQMLSLLNHCILVDCVREVLMPTAGSFLESESEVVS